jgi:hypothetical protein
MCKRYLRRHANKKTSVAVLYVDIDGSTNMTLRFLRPPLHPYSSFSPRR